MSLILRNRFRIVSLFVILTIVILSIYGYTSYHKYLKDYRVIRQGYTYGLDSKIKEGDLDYYKLINDHQFIYMIDLTHYSNEYLKESPETVRARVYILGKYEKKGDKIRLLGADKAVTLYYEDEQDAEEERPSEKNIESKKELKKFDYARAVFINRDNRKTIVTVRQTDNGDVWTGYVWRQNVRITGKYLK